MSIQKITFVKVLPDGLKKGNTFRTYWRSSMQHRLHDKLHDKLFWYPCTPLSLSGTWEQWSKFPAAFSWFSPPLSNYTGFNRKLPNFGLGQTYIILFITTGIYFINPVHLSAEASWVYKCTTGCYLGRAATGMINLEWQSSVWHSPQACILTEQQFNFPWSQKAAWPTNYFHIPPFSVWGATNLFLCQPEVSGIPK